jgi:hypothetical protein
MRYGTENVAGPAKGRGEDWIFQRYYAGQRVPCHVGCGGSSEVVRVGTAAHGGGELWMECGSCAQRIRYEVPPASAEERSGVERALDGGGEAACPRHVSRVVLQRRGRQLVCPACGVRYRE